MNQPTRDQPDPRDPRDAIVLGGGLAGIAAALRLAQAGRRVTLVEARKRLGGRAGSFTDPQTGALLDNCQHVLMGCCTNLLDLYRRLGVLGDVRWHRAIYFADAQGRVDRLEADDLPPPLHLAASLARFRLLTWPEKAALTRGMLALVRLGAAGRERWRGRTFADWLDRHHQPPGAVTKFWSPIIVSALNEWPQRADAAYAIQVFQEGFLCHENGYRMGVPAVPLSRLYESAEHAITRAGGQLLLGVRVTGIDVDCDAVRCVALQDGRTLTAPTYVSALPYDRLARLCPPAARSTDPRLAGLDRFVPSPIIGIHLWLTPGTDPPGPPDPDAAAHRLMPYPHLALTESPLQWVFNKGYDPQQRALHLHGVISAAHDLVDQSPAQIARMAVGEVAKALPGTRGAVVADARVVKEKRATFSAAPGIDAHRPTATGPIRNLLLAGDWCRTGWPATMEGAVRSGYLAAQAALASPPTPARPLALAADLTPGSVYRLISRDRPARAAALAAATG